MSDLNQAPDIGANHLAPEQIAAARDHWVSLGLDVAKFDNAMAPESLTGAPAPAGEVQDDRAGIEIMGADKTPPLGRVQAQEMAQALRDAGMPEDRVNAALAEHGYEPLAPDTRTEEEQEFDRAFPTVAPTDYRPNYFENAVKMDVADLAAVNRDFTTWAADLSLPAEIGTAVIEEALRVEGAASRMSEPARQLWVREQRFNFERLVGGPEKVEEALAKVRPLLERNPAMRDRLHRSGALDSAAVIIHLANHADRLAVRGQELR